MIEKFTYNHVVGQETQNVLIQIGENDTKNCFLIGDLVNEEWEKAVKNGWHKPEPGKWDDYVTRDFICGSFAFYLRNKSKRTVRYYADVALFFASDLREKYETLSFAHFAKARKYDDWKDYLEYALSGGPDGGQVSVDGCEAEWYKRHRETIGSLPPTEKQVEENTNKNKFSFKVVFKYVTKTLDRFKTDDRLTESARTKVDQAIGLINDAIEEMDSSLEKID